MTIHDNYLEIKQLIATYEARFARQQNSVTLLCASKRQSVDSIKLLFDAGARAFGENQVQEALNKMAALADYPIEWHFIGTIQSNKTRAIAEHFSWVHSVDSERIAIRLNEQRPSDLQPLQLCIEINLNQEASKSGILITDREQLDALVVACRDLPHVNLRGLMAIPKVSDDFMVQRQSFHELYTLFVALKVKHQLPDSFDTLSMGMSHDFEAAIAEHATIIRVGTALFGAR
jgi:pyridoxal phosphate enzyme (YggS family)